jgi:hypothetical protein
MLLKGPSPQRAEGWSPGVKKLLRQASLGSFGNAGSCDQLMPGHHGGALKEMLKNQILLSRKKTRSPQRTEGEGRANETLAPPSLPVPTPKVRIGRFASDRR